MGETVGAYALPGLRDPRGRNASARRYEDVRVIVHDDDAKDAPEDAVSSIDHLEDNVPFVRLER
jgi:hypothetical protein